MTYKRTSSATDNPRRLILRGTTLYIATGTKIFTYNVTNPLLPALTATLLLNLVGFGQRELSDFFVRDDTAFVGIGGDGEAQGALQSYDLPTGVQLYGQSFSVLSQWSMTGEP